MKKALSTAALIATLALTGCGAQTNATSGSEAAESAVAETTEAAPETTEAAPETTEAAPETTEAEPEPTEETVKATEGAADFGTFWKYSDGIEVRVTPGGTLVGSEYAAGGLGPGGNIQLFEFVITNNSDAIFDPTLFSESVQYGAAGLQADRVFDNQPGLESMGFEGKILPGKQQTFVGGYGIPVEELGDVTVVVSPSWDHIDSIFTGPVG